MGSIPTSSTNTKHDKAFREAPSEFSTVFSTAKRGAHTLGGATSAYLVSLRVAGCSSRTLENRARVLGALHRFTDDDDLAALNRARLVGFVETFRAAGRKPLTVHTYASVVHRFLRWCVEADLLPQDPLADFAVRVPKTLPRVPTSDEVRALIRACGTDTLEAQRNRTKVRQSFCKEAIRF